MRRTRGKTTPKQRLVALLKQKSSSIPEVAEFRRKLQSILPLVTEPTQIDDWLEGRFEYGLLDNPDVARCADQLIYAIGAFEEERYGVKKDKPKERVDNTEAINRRETEARNNVRFVGYKMTPSVVTRMQKGFDQILDEEIASVRRGAP